ncbi:MAG: YicC/YloC family endoribonuclease [Gemmatimonadota bacterium]|nr:YicC/YloC family endoribonuclease [Gemmatimonadota bacterium]
MIRSMTGYGSARVALEDGSVTVEARSVNSRGLKVVFKGSPRTDPREPELRPLVEERLKRGRVDIYVRLEAAAAGSGAALDEDRVRRILDACRRLKEEFGVAGEPDLATLVRAGVFPHAEPAEPVFDPDIEALQEAVRGAVAGLVEMREREGARLEADLRERLAAIRAAVEAARELAPERLERERRRLEAAVEELAGRGLDDDRLAREIALIADRWDVSEELVRAAAHLEAFDEYLAAPAAEPVGKRLGFLVQELQREINTLGAKANDPRISRLVVEAKNEIEKLREQVENVE